MKIKIGVASAATGISKTFRSLIEKGPLAIIMTIRSF
jgi:hypothetical protein